MGHKGTYARSGGKMNRGFEGGQSMMSQRMPKRGFRANRFNTLEPLEQINLGKIAIAIQKGVLNPHEPITMKHLFESGVISKIKFGVKILGKGGDKLKAISDSINTPIRLEASDATTAALDAIHSTGGNVEMTYRTPLTLKYYLKPHKFPDYKELKDPMPSPKKLKKLEKIRAKGIEVTYADAPWFTDNKEALEQEQIERLRRIAEADHADLLPTIPADRSEGVGSQNVRRQREQLFKTHKYI